MVGSSTSGGTPLRRPIAIASASAAVCWNTSMLLRIFTTWPQPIGPQWVTSVPIVSRIGRIMGEGLVRGADHDGELAARRGLARAGDRRIGVKDALRRQPGADLAGQRDRGGAGIDHALAGAQMRFQRGDHGGDRLAVRQRQQDQVAGRGDLGNVAGFTPSAASRSSGSGRRSWRQDRLAGAAGEMAAHRLAHHAEADEAELADGR